MKFLARPGFYVIALLLFAMLALTLWMQWQLAAPDLQRKGKPGQEPRSAPVSLSQP